jgi:hypothetical protein
MDNFTFFTFTVREADDRMGIIKKKMDKMSEREKYHDKYRKPFKERNTCL